MEVRVGYYFSNLLTFCLVDSPAPILPELSTKYSSILFLELKIYSAFSSKFSLILVGNIQYCIYALERTHNNIKGMTDSELHILPFDVKQ